jgi:hypothetical protein
MRTLLRILAGATGFVLLAGFPLASQAQKVESWGPKHTSYFYDAATMPDYRKGGEPKTMTFGPAPQVTPAQAQQQMYYQAPQRRAQRMVRGQRPATMQRMRPRQQQPAKPPGAQPEQGTPPDQGTPPGQQPPARGQQPPTQGTQPK